MGLWDGIKVWWDTNLDTDGCDPWHVEGMRRERREKIADALFERDPETHLPLYPKVQHRFQTTLPRSPQITKKEDSSSNLFPAMVAVTFIGLTVGLGLCAEPPSCYHDWKIRRNKPVQAKSIMAQTTPSDQKKNNLTVEKKNKLAKQKELDERHLEESRKYVEFCMERRRWKGQKKFCKQIEKNFRIIRKERKAL